MRHHRTWRAVCLLGTMLLLAGSQSGRAAEGEEDEAIREAVFRFQIALETKGDPGRILCLGVGNGGQRQSPSPTLMRRFADDARVRSVASCRVQPGGVVDTETGGDATLATTASIKRVGRSEAHVQGGYYRNARSSEHYTYRVVREEQGWVALGPILHGLDHE